MPGIGGFQVEMSRMLKQSLLTLLFDLGGIAAGLLVASSFSVFISERWIVALYPGILSMRGVIGGLFTGRLSTALHLGTINTNVFGKNAETLHSLWSSIVVLTFVSSVLLGGLSLLFGSILWGVDLMIALNIFGSIIATMGLSLVAISPITIIVAFSSFKRGLDPDIIVYPTISTVADILATLCYILVLSLLLFSGIIGKLVGLIVCAVFFCVALLVSYRNRRKPEFRKTMKEAVYTLVPIAFLVNVTGSVLSRISTRISHRPEVYIAYPALINMMGDVGAIVGSTATTRLALGTMDSSLKSIRNHKNQITAVWTASIIVSIILAVVSSIIQVPVSSLGTMTFVFVILTTNFFSAISMIVIAFGVAVLTFHRGLDPDNFVIPIESSLADAVTTTFLLFSLGLIG
jgi:mgtE-like transporter